MPGQEKKSPVSIGFLAHVGASRRAPRRDSKLPGCEPGSLCSYA